MKSIAKKTAPEKKNKPVLIVRKSNNLIEANYNFDIWEMRLFLMIISQIRRDDQDFGTYRIYYRDVAKTFGLRLKRGYAEIRESAKKLLDKKFYVSSLVDGFRRQDIYHIIRKINILEEGQEGQAGFENQEFIDVKIEDEMKPLLLQLQKSFTTYNFENIMNLGLYSIRIYELLKQYESIGHRTLYFEDMKRMFEVNDKYAVFSNFLIRVINPSIEEINKHTDLLVTEMTFIKQGKKTVGVRFDFIVQKKLKKALDYTESEHQTVDIIQESTEIVEPTMIQPTDDTHFSELYPKAVVQIVNQQDKTPVAVTPMNQKFTEVNTQEKLLTELFPIVVVQFGVGLNAFTKLVAEYTEGGIREAVKVTEQALKTGKVDNIAGFFIKAVEQGWQSADLVKQAQNEQTQQKVAQQKAQAIEDMKLLERRLTALIEERRTATNEVIKTMVQADPFLAGEAINKIISTKMVCQSLEERTGLKLEGLPMNEWRHNTPLREAVTLQIELMHPADFKQVQVAFDRRIKQLKEKIEALRS